jgi:hypothetical protein
VQHVNVRRAARPEPNFGRLVSEPDLQRIAVSAHALRRFVQRLAPDIPGAEQVAEAMADLEDLGPGRRSGVEQGQLRRHRDWMARHVQPLVLELIRCEGFWATRRPRWSLSHTPSDGYLQVGRMCLFPAAVHDRQIMLTTCMNESHITWDIALRRGYTLMPKPYTNTLPLLTAPSLSTIAIRAWRARQRHPGLLAAFRSTRAQAIHDIQLENQRRVADPQASQRLWREERDKAAHSFRERHL